MYREVYGSISTDRFLSCDGGLPLLQRGQQLRDLQLQTSVGGGLLAGGRGHLGLDPCDLGLSTTEERQNRQDPILQIITGSLLYHFHPSW